KDDDGNGQTDCADPACLQSPACPACDDGYLDPREPCEGSDLRGASCVTLGFDSGILRCSGTCQSDTSGCGRRERSDQPGDEDGNGQADCQDPTCAALPGCLQLKVHDLTAAADVSTMVHVVLAVQKGSGAPAADVGVAVIAPPGAWAPPATATGVD